MEIGEKIKKRRMELGMSQRELARRMGYSDNSTLARIEQGKVDVYQNKIVEFSKVLGVSIAYLMDWEEEQKKNDLQADIILKMRTDSDFMSAVETLYKLDKDKLQSINQMLMSNKRTAYYEKLDEIFKKERDWTHVYSCYKFIYDKSNIVEAVNEDMEIQQMNQLVIDALNEQAKSNYKKKGFTSDNAAIRVFDEDKPFFYYEGYQERQRILTDNLIRRR